MLCYSTFMDNRKYLADLRRRMPNRPSHKIEARSYKNASGVDELIYLPTGYWNYVEWAEKNTEIDFADWVVHCDTNPSEGFCLSHLLMYWLWTDECNRFRQGLPTPHPYPPMGYEGWADEFHGANHQ
ncbi:MAG: hypothetical protein MI923_08410 [Phycisphaerales bacterium]|nr:hypothetical protein [Phycisphaerales bacterium]